VSNKIDTHNQLRQHELALEELWLAQDSLFQLNKTFVGMTVTNAFQLAYYSCYSTGCGVRQMSVKDIAMRTCYDILRRRAICREHCAYINNFIAAATQHIEFTHEQRDGSDNPTR
jgi:hypothetical protein